MATCMPHDVLRWRRVREVFAAAYSLELNGSRMTTQDNSLTRLIGGRPIQVLALAAAVFISWQGVMAVPIQIGALIDGMGLNEQQAGLLGTLEITALSLVPILLAVRIGRWSKPRVALAGAVAVLAGQALSAFTDSYAMLAALRMLTGVGAGFIYGAACASIAGHQRGDQMLAWGIAAGQTALAAMLIGLPFSESYGHHRGVFITLALLVLVFFPLLSRIPQSEVHEDISHQGHDRDMVSPTFLFFFFLALTFFNVAIGMMWGFLELRGDELQLDPQRMGMVLAALPLGGVIGSGIAGLIGHRFGRMLPFLVALSCCTLACFTVAFAQVHLLLLSSTFALGIFELFVMAFFLGTASSMDSQGRIATIAGGMTMLTYGMGPGLGGVLSAFLDNSEIISISGLLCLMAAVIILPVSLLLDRRHEAKEKATTAVG